MTHLAQTARMQDSPNFRDYGRTRQHICNQRQLRSLLQLVSVCFVSLRSLPLYPVEKIVTLDKLAIKETKVLLSVKWAVVPISSLSI